MQTAVNALPDNQRMAVILRYYEELGYQEISSVLEVTPKAVERLLSRARTHLRSILNPS